jgi:adenylate cyclase
MTKAPSFEEHAILVADMVGYSAWLAEQPAATHSAFTHSLRTIFEPKVGEHGGRIVKTTGDGFLAIFKTCVAAELCARQIQAKIEQDRLQATPPTSSMQYRLAIDFGAIVVEAYDIFGIPVNAAIHMQALASPGGICVSEPVFSSLQENIKQLYTYMGQRYLKNIPSAVPIFQHTGGDGLAHALTAMDALGPGHRRSFLNPPPRLGLSVFDIFLASRVQTILPRIAQDTLFRCFSRFRDLFVTVPVGDVEFRSRNNNSYLYDAVCKELYLDYMVRGSFVVGQDDCSITIFLEDTRRREALWVDTAHIASCNVEEIDRVISGELVQSVVFHLQRNEMDSRSQGWTSADAEQFRVARRLLARGTLDSTYHAREILSAILSRCGDAGDVHIALARAVHLHGRLLAGQQFVDALELARKHAILAIEIDDLNAQAHSELAFQEMFLKRQDAAADSYQRALRLNPYDVMIQADWADCLTLMGRAREALPILQKVAAGWPKDRDWVEWNLCDAYWALDRPDRIVELLDRAKHPDQPHVHRYLAASHAKLGNAAKARQHAQKVREHQPGFSTKAWSDVVPYTSANTSEEYAESLERAGL